MSHPFVRWFLESNIGHFSQESVPFLSSCGLWCRSEPALATVSARFTFGGGSILDDCFATGRALNVSPAMFCVTCFESLGDVCRPRLDSASSAARASSYSWASISLRTANFSFSFKSPLYSSGCVRIDFVTFESITLIRLSSSRMLGRLCFLECTFSSQGARRFSRCEVSTTA